MSAEGHVITALDLDELDNRLQGRPDPDAIAVCLLHSYRNPDHERRLAEYLRARSRDLS